MTTSGRVDCHQHLWPPTLLEELRRRTRAPRLDGWTLHLDGEPPAQIHAPDHDPRRRAEADAADGVDLALVSLSSPLGIEHLPAEEAAPLLHAWHGAPLGPHRLRWAAPALVEPDVDDLKWLLTRGDVVGLQVPATALATPAALERLAPQLVVAEAVDKPVLVHPGPAAPAGHEGRQPPAWWPALTSYPAQQAAAWFAWHTAGRALLPRLRIAFVALAGLAPLHHERLAARGGDFGAVDPGVFYETSSYGPRAIDALARLVGVDPLVLGSDSPYAHPVDVRADPGLGEAFDQALAVSNPHQLIHGPNQPHQPHQPHQPNPPNPPNGGPR